MEKILLQGVHCTHGFNRSGFLICAFLVEMEDWRYQIQPINNCLFTISFNDYPAVCIHQLDFEVVNFIAITFINLQLNLFIC